MRLNELVKNEPAKVQSWGYAKAGTGTPYWYVELEIPGKLDAEGKPLTAIKQYYLTDKAKVKSIEQIRKAFGWDGNDFLALSPATPQGMNLKGLDVVITTVAEVYNGETRCKVRWVNSVKKEVTVEDILALNGR